jgi:glycolate oxidase FAD binding subunit
MAVPVHGLVAATDDDAIAGVPARYVATPDSTDEAAAVLRAAADRDLVVVVRGAGTKRDWAAPPRRLDLIVDTRRLAGVVEHAAGDLIVVVRAGTTVAELADKLAPAGQQLALDAPMPGASVGGTVAVGTSGPRRMLYGTARDLLIGVTVVRPDGVVAKAGGKVVKNVAGYDLGKLYTGSLGTLGIITEAVFRLHPLPEACRWISALAADATRAAAAIAAIRASQHDPVALEVNRPARGGPMTIGVAVEGVAGGISPRAAALATLLGEAAGAPTTVSEGPPDWWGQPLPSPHATVTCEPTGLADLLACAPGAIRGSAGAGVLAVGLRDDDRLGDELAQLRAIAARHGGSAVLRYAPPHRKAAMDVWGPVPALGLMRRLKEQFDPEYRLSPGRFVGGI